jgi:hypothetical protein
MAKYIGNVRISQKSQTHHGDTISRRPATATASKGKMDGQQVKLGGNAKAVHEPCM